MLPKWEEDGFPEVDLHELGPDDRDEPMVLGYTEQMLMLNKDDIPGASLKDKKPNELNVVQLKKVAGLSRCTFIWKQNTTDRKVNLKIMIYCIHIKCTY